MNDESWRDLMGRVDVGEYTECLGITAEKALRNPAYHGAALALSVLDAGGGAHLYGWEIAHGAEDYE